MAIYYEFQEVKKIPLPKKKISAWIKSVITSYGKKAGDVSYIFCSDEEILNVNHQYLQHDYYTDVITFDYTEGDIVSGDIFISLDTVQSNAELYQQDFETELLRVMIHGVLHLCGQGDKTDEQQREMTAKENDALRLWKEFE